MEMNRTVDVITLGATQRRALEDVIGVPLQANQRLTIGITEIDVPAPEGVPRRQQTIEDWAKIYEGMSDEQIEEIDRIAKTRADLTRNLP